MDIKAIEKAEDHLARARSCLDALQAESRTTASMKDAWYTFVQAANSIFAKLQQGSKNNQRSREWFSKYAEVRRNDELLSYIHQARHAEEHSLTGSFSKHGIFATAGNEWTKIKSSGLDGEPIKIEVEAGKPAAAQMHAPGIHLIPVTNRGVTYQVPGSHMGQPIRPLSIYGAITLAIKFLEDMVAEANDLAGLRDK